MVSDGVARTSTATSTNRRPARGRGSRGFDVAETTPTWRFWTEKEVLPHFERLAPAPAWTPQTILPKAAANVARAPDAAKQHLDIGIQ